MAAHARLKNKFTQDEKYHNLMRWLNDIFFPETWTVIGDNPEDPDERSMTVTNMVDLPNLGFMEFRMCTFSRDLLVEFNVSPYVFLIHGDGHFEFLDS